MGDLDPACPELQRLRAFHAGQTALLQGPALAEVVRRHQAEELGKHALSCERCFDHARLPTTCVGCGGALVREADGMACRARWHGLKSFFRGHRGAPRKVPLPPRRHAPLAARPEPKPAARAEPRPPARREKAPTRVAATPPPPPKPSARPAGPRAAKPQSRPRAENPLRPPKKPAADPLAGALRVLGLALNADAEAIRAAYREQAHLFHPDKAMTLPKDAREAAEARMKEVNHAYEALKRAGKA